MTWTQIPLFLIVLACYVYLFDIFGWMFVWFNLAFIAGWCARAVFDTLRDEW